MNVWMSQHSMALRLALRGLLTAPVNTLLSLLAIGIAAALPAGGQMLVGNILQLAHNTAPVPQISLFMDMNTDEAANEALQARLKAHPEIKDFQFIPRDRTLARMKDREGLADVIDALPRNPFPDAYTILPKDDSAEAMERLAVELRKLPKVAQAQLDSDWVRRLNALIRIGRTGVMLLALLLGTGLVAITFNVIRLQVATRRAEIEVSRLLGATDAFIRRPFHYYGVLLGLLGGIIAWLIVAGASWWLTQPIGELAQLYSIDFKLRSLSMLDSTLLLILSAGLGWLGASLSLQQQLAAE